MNQSTLVATEPLPSFEPERAQATLEWLRRQSLEEQRATFDYWQRALNETANGKSPTPQLADLDVEEQRKTFASLQKALEEALQTEQPGLPAAESHNATNGSLPPFDPARAAAALRVLRQGDPVEHRETYEYLKKALNEERAAHGERLLFVDDDE